MSATTTRGKKVYLVCGKYFALLGTIQTKNMKRTVFLLSLVSLFIAACGTSKNAGNGNDNGAASNDSKDPDHDTEHQIIFEDIADGDSLFASIRKGYCFGRCPVFEMSIYNSGFTTYNGIANVDLMGEHTTRLTEQQMIAFIDKANYVHYFELEDEYDNPHISDLPETVTSIVMAGKRKTVRRRHGYPQSIVVFEETFSDLLKTQNWNPGPERQ